MISYSKDQRDFVNNRANMACFSVGICSGPKPSDDGSLQIHMLRDRAGLLWEIATNIAFDRSTPVVEKLKEYVEQLTAKGVNL